MANTEQNDEAMDGSSNLARRRAFRLACLAPQFPQNRALLCQDGPKKAGTKPKRNPQHSCELQHATADRDCNATDDRFPGKTNVSAETARTLTQLFSCREAGGM